MFYTATAAFILFAIMFVSIFSVVACAYCTAVAFLYKDWVMGGWALFFGLVIALVAAILS